MGAAAVWAGLEYAEKFFMGTADVQHAMRKLVAALEELEIPYAVVGGMALNEYGYRRVTVDVDVLLTKSSLQRFKDHWLGRGYVENKAQGAKRPAGCEADGDLRSRSGVTWRGAKKFPGSRGLRDTELGVTIDVLIAGDYPGDGQPKPVQFPDPADVAIRGAGLALLPLAKLIELKLASGMSSLQRLKDLADVLELIKLAKPERALADALDAYVRDKYLELWDTAQLPDPMPG